MTAVDVPLGCQFHGELVYAADLVIGDVGQEAGSYDLESKKNRQRNSGARNLREILPAPFFYFTECFFM